MISISTTTANLVNGNVILQESGSSDLKSKTTRVTRTATLDGGAYIDHSGYTDADRTLRIEARINTAQEKIITHIYENRTFVIISMSDGVYLGAIEYLDTNNSLLKMTILIQQREY